MAKSFNLTAELNLRGPSNLGPVVSQIRKELGNISASVDIKVNKGTDRSLLTINNALNRLNNTLARTSTLSASTSSNIGDLTRSIDVLRNSLNGSTNSMARVVASTRQVATQMSRTTRNIQQSSDAMEEFGRQSRLAVKRFAAFSVATGAIYALINAISKASSEFIEFDRQITRLTQITGESKDSLSKITDTITALSTNLGVTSSDLIKVSDTLAQAGLSAKQTEQALKALAASALAPSFDSLNDTVEGSIALMRQFKIGTQDLEKALGSINAVAAGFAVEASDIITAIQRSGGVFAAASKGVSEGTDALNEFIAVFTSVRATTRESAETIATGLRTIFTRIQRESTIDALKEYGVNLQDVEGKFVGAYKAVQLLSEGLGKLDPRDVKFSRIVEELGGFRQIGKVLPLIQEFATAQQALGVAERGQASLTKDVIKAQASLAIQFAKTREKFVALIRDIGNSGSFQALVKVGLTLADTFIKVVDVARPLLPIITALAAFKGGEALTKFVGGFIGGVRSGGGAGGVGNNIGQGITGARARQGASAAQNNLRGLTANTQALRALVNPLDSLRASIVDLTNQIQSSQRAGGGNRGLSQGGVVKFARGGIVPGSGNSDTVPAMLQPGEFVIRKKAVETIGASNLHRMNKYAKGGPVVAKIANTKVADGDSLKVEFTPTGDAYNTLSRLEGWDAFETSSNVRGTKIPRWQRNLGKKATQVTQSEYEGNDKKAFEAFKSAGGKHDVYGRPMFKDDALGQKLFSMGLALPYNGRGQSPTKQMSLSDYKKVFGHAPSKAGSDTEDIQRKMFGGLIQRLASGGVAQRKIGYLDYDVLANPTNEEIIKKGMKATGTTGPRLYFDKLTEMAVQARKNSSIQKLKAIYGVAGSGKTTLSRGQGTDDAKLRKTERFPVLSPEDIERATEVLILSSSVSKDKLNKIFNNADRTFTLSSTSKSEKDRVRSQRDGRDVTGIGLEGRTPGVTSGAAIDTAVSEALLADRLGSRSVVLGRGASGNLRRKRGNELVEIIKKKIGFTWGSFSPMTAGHESIMDAAASMGISPEDFIYLVGSNEGIKAGDPSSYRTAVFDQDFRVLLAKAGAGARGARILPKPRDFEVPQGFDISSEGSDRRRVLIPAKGSRTFVADKTPEQTSKYKEAGYTVSGIERTGGISGTMVRDLIMSGDMGKLQEVLSPGVYDIISSNINRLQNRARVLPDIIEQVKKSQEASLSDIEQQIKALGISRIDNKKIASDPEYAAKVDVLQELRGKRDKIKSAGSFEPYKLLADMARKEPEKYGLDFSTSSSVLKPIRTVSSQAIQKASFGGLIKSLANSGMLKKYAEGDQVTVDETDLAKYGQIGILARNKIQSGKDILQAIRDTAVEQLSAIGGESKLRALTPIPANLTRRFRKNLIEDGTLDLVQVSKVLSDALSSKGTGDAAETERISSLAKTAIVGLQPLDYSKNFNWKLGDKSDKEIYTYVRGFSSEFLPEVADMQRKSAAMSKEFSENLEMRAALGPLSETRSGIYGPLRPLAIDFDNTLALDSRMTRMINNREEEDIPAYADPTKVADSLKRARPSALAKRLAEVEKLNPGILKRFTRILTARPQSTAELISSTLNSWGLPYEVGDITGLSQDVGSGRKFSSIPQAKAANLAQIEKLIDDADDNIKEAKRQGKQAYQYGEIPSIGDNAAFQEKMGQGNIEGSALESALAFKLGYPINLDALERNRAVDFPDGLGRGAQLFDVDPNIPTEVKRTLDGSSFEKARAEFLRFFEENPDRYNIGGLVQRFAAGGLAEAVPEMTSLMQGLYGNSNKKQKPTKNYGKIGLRSDGQTINATYFKNDQREGYVSAYKMRDYLYYVGLSKATQGYGPRLYDAVMEEATSKGAMLTSDRSSVSGAAKKVWEYYFKNRGDVKKTPLKPDDWTRNQANIDPKLYGTPETWPEPTDPAWILQTGYSKSPSLINDKNSVIRLSDKVDSGSMALQYFQKRMLGGLIKRFASGGKSEDTVPALLTPGEFVINKKAAEKIGYGKLHNLNRADKIQGYNRGGVVGGVQRLNVGGSVVSEAQLSAVGKAIDEALAALPNSIGDAVDRFGEATNQIKLGDTFDEINKKLRQQLAVAIKDIDNLGPEVVEGIRSVLGAGVKALNNIELNIIKASPSYKPTDSDTMDRVDNAKQLRKAYQTSPVAGKSLMDYMRDQMGTPPSIRTSSSRRTPADYESMLDYSDVTGSKRDIGDRGRQYAAQLAKMDPQSVDAIAKAMREEFSRAMGAIGEKPSSFGKSQSWALWEIGKQSFMHENPDQSSNKYRLADPLTDTQVRREGVQRMVGWEAERLGGRTKTSPSNQLQVHGRDLLDSVGFQFTDLADTAEQLDKQIDITKIKLQSIADVLADIPAPSMGGPGSPPGGSPPSGSPPGDSSGGGSGGRRDRFVSQRRAQFNAMAQANKQYDSAKDFARNMLLLGSVVTGGLGVFKQFFAKTSLISRGLDSLANSAGAVTGAFVAVTEGTDLLNKVLTSKEAGSTIKSISNKLASSSIGDKIASLGQKGGRLSGTDAGTLARRTGSFLNRDALGKLANPRTAAVITNTITKIGKLAAPAAAVASGLYAAANAFSDITDQIRKNKEELLADQVDKGLQRFDQALAEYTKNTIDNGNQLEAASATLANVANKQAQLADISKTNPKYGLTNIIGEGVGGLGGLLQGGGSLINSITEALGVKTRIGGSGMEGVSQRAEILDKQGVMSYLGSLLDVTGRTQYQNAKKLAPDQAFDTSKLFQPLLEKQNAAIDARFKKGQTTSDIMGGTDWKAQAEIIARSNAAVEEQTRLIDADLSVSKSARQAKIDEIRSNYAANELKKREISYLREKQGKQLDRESKDYTNSLNRMFDNMEQAIDVTSFKLEKMADAADLAANSLTGSAKVGGVKLDAINILKNPNIYGTGESNKATNTAASFFGDDKKTIGALLSVGPKIEKSILSTINTTLAENSDASEGKISAKINNAVSEDLDKLNIGKGIREKLSKQISDAITDARKNGEEKIDFSDLSEKVPALARSIDAAKRAQETAIKALEFYQTAISNYAEGVNKTVDLIISANDRLREAQSIRVRSEIELAKTLGKKISLDTVKGAARASAESKAGTSDPFKIFNNINRLEGVRRFQQENMNNAANKGLSGARDVKAFGSQLGQTTMQLKENYSALKNLAENTEVASAALEKISELKAKTEAGMNILEKYITSGPRDQIKLSQAFQRLENNMNGQTNNIMDSINVQQAYNDAIANGASISEANLAAQNAGAEDRGATLDAFNMIAPFLGDRQGEMKANVLESMMKESGVQMTPMFNQVLQSLRNPEADPQMNEAINEYRKAVELQAKANEYLGRLDSRLAIEVGQNTADAFDQSASAKSLFAQAQKSDISNGILNSINVKLSDGTQKTQVVNSDKPRTLSRGGAVYMDVGGSIFHPKGTDTVPAMLTPGEFVVNKASAQANKGILSSINRGAKYYADGGWVSPDLNTAEDKRERGKGPYTIYDTFWTLGQGSDIVKNIEKINSVQENIALLKPYSFPIFNKIPDDAFQSGYITHTSIKDKLLNSSFIGGESVAGIMPDFYMSKNVGSAALSGAGMGATIGAGATTASAIAKKVNWSNITEWLQKSLSSVDDATRATKAPKEYTDAMRRLNAGISDADLAAAGVGAATEGVTNAQAAKKAQETASTAATGNSVFTAKNVAAVGWEASKFVPVLGTVTGLIDSVRALSKGDIATAGLEAFGALAGLVPIPGVGAATKAVTALGTKLVGKLKNIPSLIKLAKLGPEAFTGIMNFGRRYGGAIFNTIGDSSLFKGISKWLPKTSGGFFSTLLKNTGIGAVAGGTAGALKAAVYDDQTPYITKSVQAKIKELLVTGLPKVSPDILKLGSVESIPGFSDSDTDFLTKDEWVAQKKAVSEWITALSAYSEWNKVTKNPQSKEVFGINEGAYTEYLMGPRKITTDKSYASIITGKTLTPDMIASQLGKPASDAWLKFKADGYPGGEGKLNKTTDAILAEQTKGMQMLSESATTDESFMKARDTLKKYYDTEIGSLSEAKDFTDKPPTEQRSLKRSAKLQELMKGLRSQVSFKKEEIDNKSNKFGLEGSDGLEVYSPNIYGPKVWQSLFSEIKKIEDEDGFADGSKPVADKLLFDPSKPDNAFIATKNGQVMGMPWSASKFQIDQKWKDLAQKKEEAAIAKFVGLDVGNAETYAKQFTSAKTNEDIPIALAIRKIKRIPLVDMDTGNERGAIEGGLFIENRSLKSTAAGFNPFYSMNAGLPKPYAANVESLDALIQSWVDANFTSMDPTMLQLMAAGGKYEPISGPSEGFLPVVKVDDKSRGSKRREAKASMTEGALPRLKFLTEKGMLFDSESRKVLTAADYYEGLDNFKEYMPEWIKNRMISTKLAKSAKDIAAENTLGFRNEDVPKLGDAIWQEVSNLDLPIKTGLQTAGDWKGLLSRDYGIESPDKITDEETLHQGVDYLGGIKQKVLEVTQNMNKDELNKAGEAESQFQTYMSALDFLYKISGGKGSNKGLSKTASDFVYKKYRSKVFDARTGKRIPGSPFVSSETTTAVQGPAKDEGLRFQGGQTGLTTEFWNVDALLADAEFRKYILGYAKGRRSSQKLRSILTKGRGNEDLGEVDKSGLNNALKEAAKRTGITDQTKEGAAGAKIVSENGELKNVEMPMNIIDASKQLTNDREIYDPVYRHALGETVLRYGDEGAKYWTQKPGDNTALAAWGTLWNEYRAKIQDMMLYLEQKDDLLFMPVSKGRTEIFPPAIAPLAGKVGEALGGLDLATIAESLMSDSSGMGIYNLLPDDFKGDPAKEQELLNSLKDIYSNNFDPNALPHVYSEQGYKSYELMKQVYDAANEAYLLFSEFNENLGTELIPPPIVYRPEEFAYGQLSEYGKALTLVKNNNASTIFEALQKQVQVDQEGQKPEEPQTLARGGLVYRAAGGIAPAVSSVDFSPRGTDTVPAMLTPGEFVVNRSSTAKFRPVLEAINSGAATSDQITQYVSRGSYIKPKYYADGGNVTGNSVAAGVLASIGLNTASIAALESFNKSASLLSETLKNLNIGNINLSQESIEAINTFSNKFDGFVQSLLKVSIPPVITLTAKHDVNVNINGISVLKNIEGMVQQTVIAEVDKALNEMSRKNEGSFER